MKRKAALVLMAVMLCVGMFAGCGKSVVETTISYGDLTVERTVYKEADLPATQKVNGESITIKDYAILTREVDKGYQDQAFILLDFEKSFEPEEFSATFDVSPSAGAPGEWEWKNAIGGPIFKEKSSNVIVLVIPLNRVDKKTGEIYYEKLPTGSEFLILLSNMLDSVPETEWKQHMYTWKLTEEKRNEKGGGEKKTGSF